MPTTTVRANLALQGDLRLKNSAGFPDNAKGGATCFVAGVLYVRGDVGGRLAWFPVNAPQRRYIHAQGASVRVWEVNHGLTGDSVAVLAYDPDGNVLPSTVVNSGGMASVDVGSPRTGYAVAFGLAFATPDQGARADSAVQPGDLAKIATSGAYNDLSGRPMLGSAASRDANEFASASHGHDDSYVKKSGGVMSGDLDLNNNVLKANDSGISNIDHIWHDDVANAWHFCSDTTCKAAGNSKIFAGSFHGSGSGLTGTASLRATGTTQSDVGLSKTRNVASYSQVESNNRYASISHNHNGHHALETDLSSTLTQLADAFNQGADEISAITIT